MMYPKKNIQDFQHENVHNNDGMENTDETQGDVEWNNNPFLEGCLAILGEQNIVQDGVIFIEDMMTLLILIMLKIKHQPLMKNLNGIMTIVLFLKIQNTWKKIEQEEQKCCCWRGWW